MEAHWYLVDLTEVFKVLNRGYLGPCPIPLRQCSIACALFHIPDLCQARMAVLLRLYPLRRWRWCFNCFYLRCCDREADRYLANLSLAFSRDWRKTDSFFLVVRRRLYLLFADWCVYLTVKLGIIVLLSSSTSPNLRKLSFLEMSLKCSNLGNHFLSFNAVQPQLSHRLAAFFSQFTTVPG